MKKSAILKSLYMKVSLRLNNMSKLNALHLKVSLKLAAGNSEENVAELLAGITGVQLVGQRSNWMNYRYILWWKTSRFFQAMEELLYRVEGELSGVLGALATGRNQGRLEGFTINMTSLDDIFLEVKLSDFV